MARSHVPRPRDPHRHQEPPHPAPPRLSVQQLQRTIGNQRTAALLSTVQRPTVQRAAPGVVAGIEVVAGLAQTASLVGDAYSASLGKLSYSSPTAQRLSADTQPKNSSFRMPCLSLVGAGPGANAYFDIEWEGNDYGEIGAARAVLNQDKSSFFQYSAANVRFDLLNNLIQQGGDKRTWQMQFAYEGSYDLFGAGYYAFQGKFAIDAFGKFAVLAHSVRDYSIPHPLRLPVYIEPGVDSPGLMLREVLTAPRDED